MNQRLAVKKSVVKASEIVKETRLVEAREVSGKDARECHDRKKLGVREDVYGWVCGAEFRFYDVIPNRVEDSVRNLLFGSIQGKRKSRFLTAASRRFGMTSLLICRFVG
jgi:hypothetical protein